MSDNLKKSEIKRTTSRSSHIKIPKIIIQRSTRILRNRSVICDAQIKSDTTENDDDDCIIIEPKIDIVEISDDDENDFKK